MAACVSAFVCNMKSQLEPTLEIRTPLVTVWSCMSCPGLLGPLGNHHRTFTHTHTHTHTHKPQTHRGQSRFVGSCEVQANVCIKVHVDPAKWHLNPWLNPLHPHNPAMDAGAYTPANEIGNRFCGGSPPIRLRIKDRNSKSDAASTSWAKCSRSLTTKLRAHSGVSICKNSVTQRACPKW